MEGFKQRATYVNRVIFVFVLVFNNESCKAWPRVSLRKKIITQDLCVNIRDLQKLLRPVDGAHKSRWFY